MFSLYTSPVRAQAVLESGGTGADFLDPEYIAKLEEVSGAKKEIPGDNCFLHIDFIKNPGEAHQADPAGEEDRLQRHTKSPHAVSYLGVF